MREIPDYIQDRVLMYTLMLDKHISKSNMTEQFNALKLAIYDYMGSIDDGFISNNSLEFKKYIEERVGKVDFSKPFAIRIKTDSVRLFVGGREIKK